MPSEGHPPKVPAGHLTDGEQVPDGTAGGQGQPGGILTELPPGNKLPNRVSGPYGRTYKEVVGPCQQGTGTG